MKIRRIGIAIALAMITFTGLGALSSSKDIALRKCQRYDLEKEPGKAVNCYEEVVLANPDSPMAHYFLGVTYVWTNDEESTRQEYEIVRRLDEEYGALLIDMISKVQPEWYNAYYQNEYKRLLEKEERRLGKGRLSAEAANEVRRLYEEEISMIQDMIDALPQTCADEDYRRQWVASKRIELRSHAFSSLQVWCPGLRPGSIAGYGVLVEYEGMSYERPHKEGRVGIGRGTMHTASGDVPIYYYVIKPSIDAGIYKIEASFPVPPSAN